MTSRTLPPVIRALAPAAALALLLSACGGSDDAPDGGEDTSAASAEGEESAAEEAQDQPSITESGLYSRDCSGFTLYSADDGTEIASLTFSNDRTAADTSEVLGHGREPEIERHLDETEHLGSCGGQLISVSPHEHLLLHSYQEVINGNTVEAFGVISEEGAVTSLSPEQEVSDFSTPLNYRNATFDPVNERIVFVEYDTTSDEGTIQAMDLHSGEISDLGSCEGNHGCDLFAVLPESGTVVTGGLADPFSIEALEGAADRVVLVSPNGETLLRADYTGGSTKLTFYSMEAALAENPDMISGAFEPDYRLDLDVRAEPVFIDDNTLLLKTNELTVWEFTEELLAEHEYSEGGFPELVPVEQTLIPEGPRRNRDAHLSPDRTEILFYSAPESGEGSWYRVPSDGSGEPEEAFQLEDPNASIRAWQ